MRWSYDWDEEYQNKIAAKAREKFADFQVACADVGDDLVSMYEWRNRDGSKHYSIRFVVDKYNGALYITGDMGEGILQVDGQFELKDWADVTLDYFEEKIKCCSDVPHFDEELFYEDFIKEAKLSGYEVDEEDDAPMLDCLCEFFRNNYEGLLTGTIREDLEAVTDMKGYDAWLSACGRRYPVRVIYWHEAMKMIKKIEEDT